MEVVIVELRVGDDAVRAFVVHLNRNFNTYINCAYLYHILHDGTVGWVFGFNTHLIPFPFLFALFSFYFYKKHPKIPKKYMFILFSHILLKIPKICLFVSFNQNTKNINLASCSFFYMIKYQKNCIIFFFFDFNFLFISCLNITQKIQKKYLKQLNC
jgi:hypothetical protein